MLYNFLRGDLGFLPVLRQLLHGDERVTEGERKAGKYGRPAKFGFERIGRKGPRVALSRSLSLSLQYAIRSFVNRPVTLSARRAPRRRRPTSLSVGVPARHRQTRGLSQSITEDLTAPLKKNLPRTERTDADERALGGAGGGRARRPMGAPLSRRAGPIGEVIRKIGKKKCAIRTYERGRTRARADGRGE